MRNDERRMDITEEGLRFRAESALHADAFNWSAGAHPLDLASLLHELRVHEIELELQNEDLRRAQIELEQSRSRYLELFEFAPVGYCTLGADGRLIDANIMAATLFGLTRAELYQMPFSALVATAYQDAFYLRRNALMESADRQPFEMQLKRHDEGTFWALIDARKSRDTSDGVQLHFAISDISAQKVTETELRTAASGLEQRVMERTVDLSHTQVDLRNEIARRKASEERLARSEEQLRAILDAASEAIITTGADGKIELFNFAAERMFGWKLSEVVGKNIDCLMPPGDVQLNLQHLSRSLQAGEKRVNGAGLDLVGLRRDGTTFQVELSVNEVLADKSRKFTGILRDVSEQRRLEEHLRQAQKMDAVARLASGIAHDFNNLLMGVIGCCKSASESLSPQHAALAPIDEIRGAVERGAALTRQLLSFGRQPQATAVPMQLNQVVSTVASIVTRMLGEDIKLEVDLCKSGGPILGDPNALEQVLMNLAVNARDAMKHGGTLRLATEEREVETPLDTRSAKLPTGRYVALVVEDTGCGISPEVQARVFEPFFTTKPTGEGSGLGLYSVYGIVERLGGGVDLQSELGRGTKLTIWLPRDSSVSRGARKSKAPAASPKAVPAIRAGHGGPATVLVAEDEYLIRLAVKHMLGRHDLKILLAETFDDAVRVATEHDGHIDLLLSDMVLPGGSGSALAETLQSLRPGLNVVFMSAYPTEVLVQQGRIPPGTLSLEKPFDEAKLSEALRGALQQRAEVIQIQA
jgi:PAS domain S-box-containing protein